MTHSLTHPPPHSLIHSLIHSLTHSFTHSLTHSFTPLTHQLTHSLTHSLTHLLLAFHLDLANQILVQFLPKADDLVVQSPIVTGTVADPGGQFVLGVVLRLNHDVTVMLEIKQRAQEGVCLLIATSGELKSHKMCL